MQALRQKDLQGWDPQKTPLVGGRMYVDECGRAVEMVTLAPSYTTT